MIRILFFTLFVIGVTAGWAENIRGIILDDKGAPLPYASVCVKHRGVGCLSDSLGRFDLKGRRILPDDTLTVSYIGYEPFEVVIKEIDGENKGRVMLSSLATKLNEVIVYPSGKIKKKTKGKKHEWALIKSYLDGEMAGECFGYEFHAKKNKKLLLYKVGFYYCEGVRQMTKMKFRINIYDMSDVKKSPSSEFKNILSKPIYFDYVYNGLPSGKYEYILPESIMLPDRAMVEIEFLENLNDEVFWFKSNWFGKRTWSKSIIDGEWEKNPFAAPFFIECVEVREK
ncbi:MAG: carboxypeptidase-like regulatory domain-containing protein [Muribaculaceae bacterium]|nr:carboxypeptidase-like regulatory domain-containing protein [Muribaculaceae bacterium]